jgi:uridine phosphorylase
MTDAPVPRSAHRVESADGRQYHLGVRPGEVAREILLVGDPGRAERVAARMERIEHEVREREYVTFTGPIAGRRLSVVGTGIGPDNTEIAVIELCNVVDEPLMIRAGSCGALQPGIALADLVVTRAAYRMETTSLHFVGEGYPAAADPEVVVALVQACDELGLPFHVGITATAPGFYGAQGRLVPGFPPRNPNVLAELAGQGVANLEMEASCLLTLASLRGFRAGAVCAVYASRDRDEFIADARKGQAEARVLDAALRAFVHLATMDAARRRSGRTHWHPGL